MRPSKPALPERARPQDLAPTVENARRLGLPQAARPEAQHGSPTPSTTQQPAEPSWGQRLNRNMRQWGEGVIDRLDEAAVADGGGLVTALAALARTPARSFTSFMQGTAGTVSLLDGRVRGEISDGLSQVMSDPGLIGRAASDYWRSRTLTDMAADLYANGAAGAMMGGAGAAALGRLNRLPGLEALADAVANAKPTTARLRQTGAVGDLSGLGAAPSGARTPATSGGTANSASGVELGLDLRTIQSANEVVESLQRTGKLPPNYVTREAARESGWLEGRALNNYVPGGQMGGDVYRNAQNIVPNAPGRIWYEADIGLQSTISRAKQPGTRLLYSNDGLLYVTRDHYENVICIGCWK